MIAQDRIAENKVFVFVNNKATPYSHVAEVRSVSERRFGIPKTTAVKLSTRGNQFGKYIRVGVHHMKHEIPLFILFRALGIESDRDIVSHIVADADDPIVAELVGSMDEASCIRTRADALSYLTRFVYHGNPKFQNNQNQNGAKDAAKDKEKEEERVPTRYVCVSWPSWSSWSCSVYCIVSGLWSLAVSRALGAGS